MHLPMRLSWPSCCHTPAADGARADNVREERRQGMRATTGHDLPGAAAAVAAALLLLVLVLAADPAEAEAPPPGIVGTDDRRPLPAADPALDAVGRVNREGAGF